MLLVEANVEPRAHRSPSAFASSRGARAHTAAITRRLTRYERRFRDHPREPITWTLGPRALDPEAGLRPDPTDTHHLRWIPISQIRRGTFAVDGLAPLHRRIVRLVAESTNRVEKIPAGRVDA